MSDAAQPAQPAQPVAAAGAPVSQASGRPGEKTAPSSVPSPTLGSPKGAQAACTRAGLSSAAMFAHLKSHGFHGGLAWQANDHDGPPNGGGPCGDTLATMLAGIKGGTAT
jgi:hypothetical protein